MKKRLYFLFLIALFTIQGSLSQTFPVTLVPQVTPPSPIYFSSYADASSINNPLQLQIILNDLSVANREIRLKSYFEGNGIAFQSKDIVIGAPSLFVEGGIPLTLTNVELAPYFTFENIIGVSPSVYGQVIPEGSYQFCFEVFDVLTGARISQKTCATTYIFQNEPPLLIAPNNRNDITEQNPLNQLFQWTPRHINVSNVQYELSIVEIWDQTINPQAAFLASPPFFQTTTTSTSYLYGPADPLFLPNKRYAWRVQAKAISGAEEIGLFKNNGFSEVYWFNYIAPCDTPDNARHEVKGAQQVNILWDDFTTDVPEFIVRYREKGNNNEWFFSRTNGNWITLWDLRPGTTYEYQVNKKCLISESEYSILQTFTTLEESDETSLIDCGISPDMNIENMEPLERLLPGSTFTAGDFPVKVTEVSGGNGRFTGKGYVSFPYLKNIKVAVNFTNVFVNNENQLAEGTVVTVYDPSWGNILDVDEVIDVAEDIADVVTGGDNIEIPQLDYDINTSDISITDGQIIVTNPNGAQDTFDYDEGDTYTITDASGDEWTVDDKGNVTQTGTGDPSPPLTSDNASGIKPGQHSGTIEDPYVDAITNDIVKVTFRVHKEDEDKTRFALDLVNNVYETSNYPKINASGDQSYYPVHKAAVQGENDVFYADIEISDAKISIDSLIIKTVENKAIKHERIAGTNTYKVTISGANPYRTEECVVTYLDPADNTYKIAASFFVHHIKKHTEVPVQVVTVNGGNAIANFETELNIIFGRAGGKFKVKPDVINLTIAQDSWDTGDKNGIIDYDGSGILSDYPTELKNIYKEFKNQYPNYDSRQYFIFILGDEFTVSKPLSGFMPKTRQWGFLFEKHMGDGLEKKDSALKVAAHELGHGVYTLDHPFGENADNAGQASTWLMDYGNGTELGYPNWATMSDPSLKLMLFQDDSDGELIQNTITEYLSIDNNYWREYCYLSPVGTAILLDDASHVLFNEDGAVLSFIKNNEEYIGTFYKESQKFLGYIKKDYWNRFIKGKIATSSEEALTLFESLRYKDIKYAPVGKQIFSIFKKKYKNAYLDCIVEARWSNKTLANTHTGIASPPFFPEGEGILVISRGGKQCGDAEANGVIDGPGVKIYYALDNDTPDNQKQDLIEFSNYITTKLKDKTFAFYNHELQKEYSNSLHGVLKYLKKHKIYSKDKFTSKEHFPIETFARDAEIIFSSINLREGIPENYNKNSKDWKKFRKDPVKVPYEYSFNDLKSRLGIINGDTVFKTAILNLEENGNAEAISMKDGYIQYTAQFGTDSGFYAWGKFAVDSGKDVAMAAMIHRLIAQHGVQILSRLGSQAKKEFIKGATIEALGNISAGVLMVMLKGDKLTQEEISKIFSVDFLLDITMAGFKEIYSGPTYKYYDFFWGCAIGIDSGALLDLIYKFKQKPTEEIIVSIINLSGECLISGAIGQHSDKIKTLILKNTPLVKNGFLFFKDKLKMGTPETVRLLKKMIDFENLFKNKNKYYKEAIEQMLASKSGVKAIDLLIKADFNITRLSASNLKRLTTIIEKHGYEDKLVNLFKGVNDVNRLLIFLEKKICSPEEYKKLINKILEKGNKQFKNTVTIKGKTMSYKDVFNDISDVYKYYHTVKGNRHYFAKIHEKNTILIVVDSGILDVAVGTVDNITKDLYKEGVEEFFKEFIKVD
ncbi:fibronectin type III domain-containing protein [Aquimarina sediminis]|uniref:fibronectin type III domain-containing protein n=1 Tax=Aquimarina sediminis TaxID=2070536 RepID=UPI000CA04FDA|nr:fibronectin type III domain-containing protein [Aquimarina sediminis]